MRTVSHCGGKTQNGSDTLETGWQFLEMLNISLHRLQPSYYSRYLPKRKKLMLSQTHVHICLWQLYFSSPELLTVSSPCEKGFILLFPSSPSSYVAFGLKTVGEDQVGLPVLPAEAATPLIWACTPSEALSHLGSCSSPLFCEAKQRPVENSLSGSVHSICTYSSQEICPLILAHIWSLPALFHLLGWFLVPFSPGLYYR